MVPRIVHNPPAPGTPEWVRLASSSKVAAILGISRYSSQYTVWNEIAGKISPSQLDEDLADWGHSSELSLADFWRRRHRRHFLNPKRGGTHETAFEDPDLPFPHIVTIDRLAQVYRKYGGDGKQHIIECKTRISMDDWGRPGEPDSIPADYYAQVIFQMGVSGIHEATVVVDSYRDPEFHEVTWDPALFENICGRVHAFMDSIASGVMPELDESVSTYETVRGLHPDIDRDATVELDVDEAVRILDAAHELEAAKDAERAAKIRLADTMGTAYRAMCGDVKIADRRAKKGATPFVQINKKANLSRLKED